MEKKTLIRLCLIFFVSLIVGYSSCLYYIKFGFTTSLRFAQEEQPNVNVTVVPNSRSRNNRAKSPTLEPNDKKQHKVNVMNVTKAATQVQFEEPPKCTVKLSRESPYSAPSDKRIKDVCTFRSLTDHFF